MQMRNAPFRMFAWGLSLSVHAAVVAGVMANAGIATSPAVNTGSGERILQVRLHRTDDRTAFAAIDGAVLRKEDRTLAERDEGGAEQSNASAQPLIPLVQAPEQRYFLSRELSGRPRVREDVPSDFGLAGVPAQTVILRLFINEVGDIDRVAVERSFLPEEQSQRLIEAFSKVRFHPGARDNVAVKSQMKIEVRLEDGTVLR